MKGPGICGQCGHYGYQQTKVKGSFLIEVVLWLCFILPGLIYSIWRAGARVQVCPSCGAENSMVPPESPVGKKLAAEFSIDLSVTPEKPGLF
jgi:hypothetical protein